MKNLPVVEACLRCGSSDVDVLTSSDQLEHRGVFLDVGGMESSSCSSCGLRWESLNQEAENSKKIRAAYSAERDRARSEMGLLDGAEIAAILESLDLSKSEASRLLGGGPHAFTKYINGEVLQSVAMDRLLRLTAEVGEQAVKFLRGEKFALRNFHVNAYDLSQHIERFDRTYQTTFGSETLWLSRSNVLIDASQIRFEAGFLRHIGLAQHTAVDDIYTCPA